MEINMTALTTTNNEHDINKASFAFGDPVPVGGGEHDLFNSFYDPYSDTYSLPISFKGLDALSRSNAVHRRCINFKVAQMGVVFKETKLITLKDFNRACRDLQTFGNVCFQAVRNGWGEVVKLHHLPALNMRKMKNGRFKMLQGVIDPIVFKQNEVLSSGYYDTGQTVYGMPDWIGALHDVFLNSEATLFRRRYYLNGAHMGYILYTTDPNLDKEIEEEIKENIRQGKGAGNFKQMYINIPNGKDKGVQVIPIGDTSQKDEFQRIKNISGDDIMLSHGVQPVLIGVKPENSGGFGDIEKTEKYYRKNEVPALVSPFLELNEHLTTVQKFAFDFDVNTL
jgi:PBSX family phage portal protein